ncbi:hypothetical protein [Galbibacter sp. PAP.153]|uniref:hypothetical protein n=1 Tax=Galbibacter sp. PAP.153 TaxID=3104623 RepID=UPI0030082518
MTTTLEKINREIIKSYSHSLSEEERVNKILDHINDKKKEYSILTKSLEKLGLLLTKITWLDNLSTSDEVIIRGIIAMGKASDKHFKKFYSEQRKIYVPKGLFKDNFKEMKEAIDFHIEAVNEVEHIIFELRKNNDFKELSSLVNEL